MSVNNIGLKSYEDLFKDDKGRKTEEIVPMDIKELKLYAEQPFKVLLDSSMDELCESIAQNGVLSPTCPARISSDLKCVPIWDIFSFDGLPAFLFIASNFNL